jgi:4-amino-4-deoxy-L-arabinose transferase-like glycosyltransferase
LKPSWLLSPSAAVLGLCLAAAPALFVALPALGYMDNEGRYAEVARELLASGDWITPHLNGEVFLNKPPLMFWLTALLFRLCGQNEHARLLSGLATLGTALCLFGLGRRLGSPRAGAWAAAVYLSGLMTCTQGRTLIPDMVMTCALTAGLLGAVRVAQAAGLSGVPRTELGGHLLLWLGAAVAVMAKGMLGLLLPVLTVVLVLLLPPARTGRWGNRSAQGERPDDLSASGPRGGWRARLAPFVGWPCALGAGLALAVVVPWHAAAGLRNPGFWWDYVINQHLLFFLDRKFPRDSVPDPLWYIWLIYLQRLFPWTFLFPAALLDQVRRARRQPDAARWLPLAWAATLWLLFSASPSHLEHYFLPAVPPAALLLGFLCDRWSAEPASPRRLPFFAALLTVGAVAAFLLPPILRGVGALDIAPGLLPVGVAAGFLLALGGGAGLALARAGRMGPALAAVAAAGFALAVTAEVARIQCGDLISPRALIRRIPPSLLEESAVAYEAGEEYQLCGVLAFYLRRPVLLPEPPGFIPPTYLRRDVGRLFVPREEFWRSWAEGRRRYLLFSNPELPYERAVERMLSRPDGLPREVIELDRDGSRLLLTNGPPGARFPREPPAERSR